MHTYMGLFSQEPPKEDLTVSEKFQLVLDVAQKAQVAPRTSPDVSIRKQAAPGFNSVCFKTLLYRTCSARWRTCWRRSRSR